jgi:drug/metabolite transporter superfamily protein YnfA
MDYSPFAHYTVCNVIMMFAIVFGGQIGMIVGGIVCIILLLTKEWMDKRRGGKFDWKDIVMGLIGTAVPIFCTGKLIGG